MDFVGWLRVYNQGVTQKVRFCGVDLPGSVRTPLPALEATAQHAAALGLPDAAGVVGDILHHYQEVPFAPDGFHFALLPLEPQRQFLLSLQSLEGRLDAVAARTYAARCLANARAAIEAGINVVVAGNTNDVDPEVRDGHMAANVQWLLDITPGARIVVLAANGHVQRSPMFVPGSDQPLRRGMGQFLSPALGPDLVTIGSTFGHLPSGGMPTVGLLPGMFEPAAAPGSLDAAMSATGLSAFLLDLRDSSGDARRWLEGRHTIRVVHMYAQTHPIPAFDALYHVDRLTSSTWS